MKYKITVALASGDLYDEIVDAVDASSPLTAIPLAMTGAFVNLQQTNTLTNPVTLPSGRQGDVIKVEMMELNGMRKNVTGSPVRQY